MAAKSMGDAPVGSAGLPVDAVGVDLEQDGDAVPGTAGDLGRGHPRVEPQRDGGVPQVIEVAAQRGLALRFGEGLLPGLCPHRAVGGVLDDAARAVWKIRLSGWCRTS